MVYGVWRDGGEVSVGSISFSLQLELNWAHLVKIFEVVESGA
jgi:hypothetical protein